MTELLDRILLDGLGECGFKSDGRSFTAALQAMAMLDPPLRRSVLALLGDARMSAVRSPKEPVPEASEDEALFGLLVLEDRQFDCKGQPSDVLNALRQRAAAAPESLATRAMDWRRTRSFAALKAYARIPVPMRAALDRALVSAGCPALHDDPDALTFAKGIALVPAVLSGVYPDTPALAALTPDDIATLAVAAAESSGSGFFERPLWSDRHLGHVAALHSDLLQPHLVRLARSGAIDPSEMFWRSGELVAEALLPLVADREIGWQALTALCWTRDAKTIERAANSLTHTQSDREALKPHLLAACAEFQPDGSLRELAVPGLRRLAKRENDAGIVGVDTTLFVPSELDCPGCTHDLPVVFDLDLRLPEFARFAALCRDGSVPERLRVAGCAICAYYHNYGEPRVVCAFDWRGGVAVGPTAGVPKVKHDQSDFLIGLPPSTEGVIDRAELSPLSAMVGVGGCRSHLGGFPRWDQDTDSPECPGCSRAMLHIGSIERFEFVQEDGSVYAFICPDCRLSTVVVQTT